MNDRPYVVVEAGLFYTEQVHVIPLDDDMEHKLDCSCEPQILKQPNGVLVVVHRYVLYS